MTNILPIYWTGSTIIWSKKWLHLPKQTLPPTRYMSIHVECVVATTYFIYLSNELLIHLQFVSPIDQFMFPILKKCLGKKKFESNSWVPQEKLIFQRSRKMDYIKKLNVFCQKTLFHSKSRVLIDLPLAIINVQVFLRRESSAIP